MKNSKNLRKGLNENYFENIDTEQKAYFLGLIVADGTIIKDKETTIKKAQNRLVISLQERDKEILEILNKEITPYKELTIWEYKNKPTWSRRFTFKVNSNKLCNDLEKLKIFSRKSGNEVFPNLPDYLIKHFIRGYFDGDGCCYVKTINKTSTYKGTLKNVIIFVCLNKLFLQNLQKKLNNIGVITERIKKDHRQNIFDYRIENKKDTNDFFHFIYTDATIFLKRKYNKFLQGNPVLTNIITDISSVETSN